MKHLITLSLSLFLLSSSVVFAKDGEKKKKVKLVIAVACKKIQKLCGGKLETLIQVTKKVCEASKEKPKKIKSDCNKENKKDCSKENKKECESKTSCDNAGKNECRDEKKPENKKECEKKAQKECKQKKNNAYKKCEKQKKDAVKKCEQMQKDVIKKCEQKVKETNQKIAKAHSELANKCKDAKKKLLASVAKKGACYTVVATHPGLLAFLAPCIALKIKIQTKK